MKFPSSASIMMRKAGKETQNPGSGDSSMAASRGFTIIEIAICLGIIGFALVAIIAALPRGLDVQKRNREETIIGQDAGVWMNALRNGAQGYDDLTNYVLCISNLWTKYDFNYRKLGTGSDFYTSTNSSVTSPLFSLTSPFLLTNGMRIIGLLSMPKLLSGPSGTPLAIYAPPPNRFGNNNDSYVQSNYVVAYVRSFSGAAVMNVPQNNPTILADSFIYRMIVENYPYVPVDTNAFCLECAATNGLTEAQMAARTNLYRTELLLQTNTQDFRLRFRWPVLPNGEIPSYGALTFRSIASGPLLITNDPSGALAGQSLYFVQASTYLNQNTTNLP